MASQNKRKSKPLYPAGMKLDTFLASLKKCDLLDAPSLKQLMKNHQVQELDQLIALLLDKELLTKFQIRAISHGTTKGLTLGKYQILDKIGEGGMGAVYKARHSVLDRMVALKVLTRESKKQEAMIRRFLREAKTAAKLSHRNIVSAQDSGIADGYHYFAMEFIEGKNLSQTVRRNGPLPVSQAIDYTIQIAQGLEYSHLQGIIHRDIKPANVLVDQNGTIKILDMGLARVDDNTTNQTHLTQEGSVMGTVEYMSPEQALDATSADRRSDLYSLGCTLFFLLSGKPPFAEGNQLVKMLAHREQPAPDLCLARPEVPAQLNAIFQRLMAKDSGHRYQTATELINELQTVSLNASPNNLNGPLPPPVPLSPPQYNSSDSSLFVNDSEASEYTSFELDPVRESFVKTPTIRKLQQLPKLLQIGLGAVAVLILFMGVYLVSSLFSGTDPVEVAVHVVEENVVSNAESNKEQLNLPSYDPSETPSAPKSQELSMLNVEPVEPPSANTPNAVEQVSKIKNVTFGKVQVGALDATVTIEVEGGPYQLDGWIDFNSDGSFGGPGEKIFSKVTVNVGPNQVEFEVPSWTLASDKNAIFQITSGEDKEIKKELIVKIIPPKVVPRIFGKQNIISDNADGAESVYAIDIDQDGDIDVLSASLRDNKIAWYENDGNQKFKVHVISMNAKGVRSVIAEDIDYDGDIDVVCALAIANRITWYKNDGNQNFTEEVISSSPFNADLVLKADLNNDGFVDILSSSYKGIALYENFGAGKFNEVRIRNSNTRHQSLCVADLDLDGNLDLLSSNFEDNQVVWYQNNGTATFKERVISIDSDGILSLFAADVDKDGLVDIVCSFVTDSRVAWYRNNGNNEFQENSIRVDGSMANSVLTVDLNDDGHLDVISSFFDEDKIVWYKNDGQQNFKEKIISSHVDGANSIFAIDLDSDGDLDLLSSSYNDDKIAWYENLSISNSAPVSNTPTSPPVSSAINTPVDPSLPDTFLNSNYMRMQLIKPGKFMKGENSKQEVISKAFYMGTYEVTQKQYERVMGSNPSEPIDPNFPVNSVIYKDAEDFCKKLSELPKEKAAGRTYRLPTDLEWEYACRAGTDTKFFYGDNDANANDYGWNESNAEKLVHSVGQKRPNPWGLYDMYGNVIEICMEKVFFPRPKDVLENTIVVTDYCKARGGNIYTKPDLCNSSLNSLIPLDMKAQYIGFRVVMEIRDGKSPDRSSNTPVRTAIPEKPLQQTFSFFGIKDTGSHICIIADNSGSMKNANKMNVLKNEIYNSVKGMGKDSLFQLIYFAYKTDYTFSNNEWANPKLETNQLLGWLKDLPAPKLISRPRNAFKAALALDPQPDKIIFITDGTESDTDPEAISRLLSSMENPPIVHTIAMEEQAVDHLQKMAEQYKGEFVPVLAP